ncbi:MAG: hypothetical protein ACK5LK_02170 [Chthoniobacterales bacterium]
MKMRFILSFLLLGSFVFAFSACTTSRSSVNPALVQSIAQAGATGDVLTKIQSGSRLDYDDIYQLVSEKVPTHMIESYLQSTEASYQFSPAQLARLRSAGASSQLLSYLQNSEGFYHPRRQAAARSQGQPGAYLNTPLAQDREPFAYSEPMVDDFYNSAYEESLYSPFNMN